MENLLLARLPDVERERLRPNFERVTLNHGDRAIVPDEPIRHVYFPLTCLLSMVTCECYGRVKGEYERLLGG
jgi:hypothetical protein